MLCGGNALFSTGLVLCTFRVRFLHFHYAENRGSKIKLKVEGTLVKVWERSVHPDYNRYLELDLYSGKKTAAPLG